MNLSDEAKQLDGAIIRIPDRAERCYAKDPKEANYVIDMFANTLRGAVAGTAAWNPGAGVLLGYDNVTGQLYAAFVDGIDPSAEVTE